MTRHVLVRRAAAAAIVIAAACTRSESAGRDALEPVITDSAGVTFVAIADAERPFPDSLEEVLRIFPADSGLGAFESVWPDGVASNGRDRIYVLARDDAQIVSFDDQGTPLARWGRRGSGPGEFEYGNGLVVDTDGTVGVFDFVRNQLLRFGRDGAILPAYTFERDSTGSPGVPIIPLGESLLFTRIKPNNDSSSRSLMLVTGRDARDTTVVATLTTALTTNVSFTSCPVRMSGVQPYFSPTVSVAAGTDGWVVQRGRDWRVEFYNGSKLTRVWTRTVPTRPTTADLLERELRQEFELRFPGGSCKIPIEEVASAFGMAATIPALRRIVVAPDGTVWAERFEPFRDVQRVDVIAPDGVLLGTITGRGAPLAFLQGGRVLYSETDEDTDLMNLVVLRVPNVGW